MGRRATCPECEAELHSCLNCRHYDEASPHECREPHAEKVVEKDRANACELFQPGDGASRRRAGATAAARDALSALFGEAPARGEQSPRDDLDTLFRKP